ncbi:MAG: hydroxymethylbilane synthase [Phycisphaerae bacterium]|nr:hydroxymethylbilane synthase [Phycisphaerae bacterium]
MNRLRIATRSSSLAIIQTQIVVDQIAKHNPALEFEIVEIKTDGDIDKKKTLWKLSETGFFTAAVENALRQNKADIAVHSYKDLPIGANDKIVIAAVLDRNSCQDCLICKDKIKSLSDLPKGAKIGTSSLRRKAQILHARNDLKCEPIRGNVPTRIKQVEKGQFDAAVLAYAGIERLELTDRISLSFDPTDFIPAPAQGAIAVQAKAGDNKTLKLLAEIDDRQSRIASETERLVFHRLKAGCHAPAGVFAQITGDNITVYAFVSDENGRKFIKRRKQGDVKSAKKVAEQLADELLKAGAGKLLKNE